MSLYFHPVYSGGLDDKARFPKERYDLVHQQVKSHGAPIAIRTPAPAGPAAIMAAHERSYVERFLTGCMQPAEQSRIGLKPWKPEIVERTLTLVGGSLAALEDALASKEGIAANMAGGTHHAAYGHGAGYCIFNDLAICAQAALKDDATRQVAILDLDVHQGDGTATIFSSEPRVFTASVHCASNFPFRKQRSDLDIELPRGAGDDAYLEACQEAISQSLAIKPDLVLFQAGVDALADDALGHMTVSAVGMAQRNAMVFEATRGLPLVIFMGGGYSKPITHTVSAFVDLFVAASYEHVLRLGRSGEGGLLAEGR